MEQLLIFLPFLVPVLVAHLSERHRHRYEFYNKFRDELTKAGLKLTGLSPDGRLVEIVELEGHPWFVAVQFHPELKSRPTKAHPLFRDLVKACLRLRKSRSSTISEEKESVKKLRQNRSGWPRASACGAGWRDVAPVVC